MFRENRLCFRKLQGPERGGEGGGLALQRLNREKSILNLSARVLPGKVEEESDEVRLRVWAISGDRSLEPDLDGFVRRPEVNSWKYWRWYVDGYLVSESYDELVGKVQFLRENMMDGMARSILFYVIRHLDIYGEVEEQQKFVHMLEECDLVSLDIPDLSWDAVWRIPTDRDVQRFERLSGGDRWFEEIHSVDNLIDFLNFYYGDNPEGLADKIDKVLPALFRQLKDDVFYFVRVLGLYFPERIEGWVQRFNGDEHQFGVPDLNLGLVDFVTDSWDYQNLQDILMDFGKGVEDLTRRKLLMLAELIKTKVDNPHFLLRAFDGAKYRSDVVRFGMVSSWRNSIVLRGMSEEIGDLVEIGRGIRDRVLEEADVDGALFGNPHFYLETPWAMRNKDCLSLS